MNPPVSATVHAAIERAKQRLFELKKQEQEKKQAIEQTLTTRMKLVPAAINGFLVDSSRDWNEEQSHFIQAGLQRKSICLIGSAGTGKTSSVKGLVNSLLQNNMLAPIRVQEETKWFKAGKPGILLCSFTNMAVRQIAKHFSNEVTCITIHKAIEFVPVFYEVEGPDGELIKKMKFEPSRNRFNPLPRSLTTIIVDESSMPSIELIEQLEDALPNPSAVQWIFIGDLNQLPPVRGKAILGKKLLELPVVELTQIYRQALQSPIITLAIKMKNGETIAVPDKKLPNGQVEKLIDDRGEHGKVVIAPWSKSISGSDACNKAANFLKIAIRDGVFDPFQDMALCPHSDGSKDPDRNFGDKELNRNIANWLGKERNAEVFEVIAGFNKHYFAIGDKLLVNKRECVIINIQKNRSYIGKRPLNPAVYDLDRWGGARKKKGAEEDWEDQADDIDAILEHLAHTNQEIEDRTHEASHLIKVRFTNGTNPKDWLPSDSEETVEDFETLELSSSAEINATLFGYVISVHKSQGSEWRKVFFLLHSVHAQMCSRELLYTGITRAAKELYIICEPDRGMKQGTLTKAAKSPRLKGNTLAEKLASLKESFEKDEQEKGEDYSEGK